MPVRERKSWHTGESGPSSEAPSGIRRSLGDVPKLWEDDLKTDVSQTTALIPSSTRKPGRPRLTIMTGLSAGQIFALDTQESYVIGRTSQADIVVEDPGVSRTHCRLVRREGRVFVQDLGARNGTRLNGNPVICVPLHTGDRLQLGPNTVLQFNVLDEAEDELARSLFEASTRDPLTGAFNRRYFEQRLATEVSHSRRHGSPLSLFFFDLDHFKSINDRFGHLAGDALLRAFASSIMQRVRTEDLFARYGGEEFALLVRDIAPRDANIFAECLRARVAGLGVPFEGKTVQATVSVGVAALRECGPDAEADALVSLADKRLYAAKRGGRNRVCSR